MLKKKTLFNQEDIKSKIYTIRDVQVMLDRDLAKLYGVLTKNLNKAVKRNIERFPEEFMFQLTEKEFKDLRFQNGTSIDSNSSKDVMPRQPRGGRRYLPYVFTEQGVAMLSGVLKSDTAVDISIQVMNAFVKMRKFIASNVQIFQRLDNVEKKQIIYDKNFEKIFNAIESKKVIPKKGIFFEGQVFDAHNFVSDIIRSARKSIILVDNFVDDSVLTLLNKRDKDVKVIIFTKIINKRLRLDLKKYNSQYPPIEIKEFKDSHDRFLILDDKEVFHFGASLKDLGKKWFAFSKFDKEVFKLLGRLDLK